jgi:hypothetical protein
MDFTPDHRDMATPSENIITKDMLKRKIPQSDKDAVKKRLFMTGKTEPFKWTYKQRSEDCLVIDENQTDEKTIVMNERKGDMNMEVQDTKNKNERYVSINIL